jgi:hypothetical protein
LHSLPHVALHADCCSAAAAEKLILKPDVADVLKTAMKSPHTLLLLLLLPHVLLHADRCSAAGREADSDD